MLDPNGPRLGLCWLLCCCLLSVASPRLPANEPLFRLVEVAPGNFVHPGRHAGRNAPDRDDSANIGFIVGDECVAVVDSGGSITVGAALRRAIRNITARPVCYVINTHIHFDHVLGNAAFKTEHPIFVGHANLAGELAANRDFFLNNFAHYLGTRASEGSLPGGELLVVDSAELDLGNRILQLKAQQAAHSNTDLSILDVRTGTFWAGDLVFMERVPVLDGNLVAWDAFTGMLASETWVTVVPGHGPPVAERGRAIIDQHRYIKVLLHDVRAAIATGTSLEQAMRSVAVSERDSWLLFDETHPRNISRAYKELEWE